MDIKSKSGYPAGKLSNFAPNGFVIDEIECASMEGFLQSLKFKDANMQVEICKLVGMAAKRAGANKNWKKDQKLWWRGEAIERKSQAYQDLLDRAFDAMSENKKFRKALLATQNAVLTHSIGKRKPQDTVLTRSEFCSRLMKIRERIKGEADS